MDEFALKKIEDYEIQESMRKSKMKKGEYFCPECGESAVSKSSDTGIYIDSGEWASTYRCKECGFTFLMSPGYYTDESEDYSDDY